MVVPQPSEELVFPSLDDNFHIDFESRIQPKRRLRDKRKSPILFSVDLNKTVAMQPIVTKASGKEKLDVFQPKRRLGARRRIQKEESDPFLGSSRWSTRQYSNNPCNGLAAVSLGTKRCLLALFMSFHDNFDNNPTQVHG